MSKVIAFLKDRLGESSTKTVIGLVVGAAVGAKVSPENQELIVNALIGALIAIAALWGQDKKPE